MGRRFNTIIRVLTAVALTGAVLSTVAADSPRTPIPQPPKAAKGTECVEPVSDMRRNHMVYLDHERDQTVHKGIRGRKHSLKGCVECHAVPDPVVAGESPRSLNMPPSAAGGARTVAPFCADCHRYAAVRIDCFGCHAATPEALIVRPPTGGTAAAPAGRPQ